LGKRMREGACSSSFGISRCKWGKRVSERGGGGGERLLD
jgi:hypothetical protein